MLLDIIDNVDDIYLYAIDETGIRLETNNFYSWSPKGEPKVIEKNGSRKGLNIIGATEITKDYKFYYKSYSAEESMTAERFVDFLDHLLLINKDKFLLFLLDNSKIHTANIVKEYAMKNSHKLALIFQPAYSPELNPQENMWKWLKDFCNKASSYICEKELRKHINKFQVYTNNTPSKVKKRVDARNFYK